jgi:hypothetical protein
VSMAVTRFSAYTIAPVPLFGHAGTHHCQPVGAGGSWAGGAQPEGGIQPGGGSGHPGGGLNRHSCRVTVSIGCR